MYSRKQSLVASGFTLVELLEVIGIIALLVAILLPALGKAGRSAETTVCVSIMHQIGVGFQMYCDANRGWLPSAGEDGDPAGPLQSPDNRGWASEGLWFNAISFRKTYDQIRLDAVNGGPRIPIDGDHHGLVCPSARPAGGALSGTDADQMTPDTPDGYFLMHGYVNDSTSGLGRDQRDTLELCSRDSNESIILPALAAVPCAQSA